MTWPRARSASSVTLVGPVGHLVPRLAEAVQRAVLPEELHGGAVGERGQRELGHPLGQRGGPGREIQLPRGRREEGVARVLAHEPASRSCDAR